MSKGDIETYHEDGQWKNRAQGNSRASNVHDTKAEAQAAGLEMARDRGVEHVIKKMDGTIGEKNSYGRAPTRRRADPRQHPAFLAEGARDSASLAASEDKNCLAGVAEAVGQPGYSPGA